MPSIDRNFAFSLSAEAHSDGGILERPVLAHSSGEAMRSGGGWRRSFRRSRKIGHSRVKRLGQLRQRRVLTGRGPVVASLEARLRRVKRACSLAKLRYSYAKLRADLNAMGAKLDAMKTKIEETTRLIDRMGRGSTDW